MIIVVAFGRSADVALWGGGEAGGVIGYFGEKGDDGIARCEDLNGAGLIVSLRDMADVGA